MSAVPACTGPEPQSRAEPLGVLSGLRVLLGQEDGMVLFHSRRVLESAGMVVESAVSTGEATVETALRERPDVVMVDAHLEDVDGLEVARRILRAYRPCVVLYTADAGAEFLQQARAIGVSGCVVKPVNHTEMLRGMCAAVAAHSGSAGAHPDGQ